MHEYLDRLTSSSLPFPLWVAGLIWATALLGQYAIARARLLDQKDAARAFLGPLVAGAAVITLSSLGASTFQAFFAGGWCVMTVASLVLMFVWSREKASDAALLVGRRIRHLGVASAFALLLALALPHLAFLGAAVFLGATALGYLRKRSDITGPAAT